MPELLSGQLPVDSQFHWQNATLTLRFYRAFRTCSLMIATYASVSLRMNTPTPRPCWIYGDPANTDEHRRKRSDLVARYGASWTPEQQPFVIRGDASTRSTRIQGPNNRKNLSGCFVMRATAPGQSRSITRISSSQIGFWPRLRPCTRGTQSSRS